jgi:ParB family chromosome partitioning protein
MASKLEQQMAANAGTRRKPEHIDDDVSGTIFGKMGRETDAPVSLPLSQILRSRFQRRGKRDQDYMENLVESVRMEGLLDPIIVRPLPAGTKIDECYFITPPDPDLPLFELVAGDHRVEAFHILGRPEIPAFIRHLSDAEAARALTSENTTRKDMGDWELYQHAVMLRGAGAVSNNSDLARVLNVHRTVIPLLEGFAALPQSAHDLLHDHPGLIGYNLAHKLKAYCPQHATWVFDALVLVSKGKLNQGAVPEWIEKKVNPRQTRPRKDLELGHGVRLIVSADGARVSGNIDYDALHKLVEENLPRLLKAH